VRQRQEPTAAPPGPSGASLKPLSRV
jgi:hypothetical protein